MKNHGHIPDLITYNTLIYACAINGDLEMARNILIYLVQKYLFIFKSIFIKEY